MKGKRKNRGNNHETWELFFSPIRHIRSMFLIFYSVFKLHFMYLKFGRTKIEIVYLVLDFQLFVVKEGVDKAEDGSNLDSQWKLDAHVAQAWADVDLGRGVRRRPPLLPSSQLVCEAACSGSDSSLCTMFFLYEILGDCTSRCCDSKKLSHDLFGLCMKEL